MRETHELIAGHRRLEACKSLGWTHIDVRFFEDLTRREQLRIEITENEKRKNFEWQEYAKALERFHEMCKQEANDPATWRLADTAAELGITPEYLGQYLNILEENRLGSINIENYEAMSQARNAAIRAKGRRQAAEVAGIHALINGGATKPNSANGGATKLSLPCTSNSVIHADFVAWADNYDGQPFNALHIDFPYGLNSEKSGQGATHKGIYDDSEENAQRMRDALRANLDRICAPQAQMIFWFATQFSGTAWEFLNSLPGFEFDPRPLIWVREGNQGIVSKPQYGPRHNYETAFFGWRGGQMRSEKYGVQSNVVVAPPGDLVDHPHVKPLPVMEHHLKLMVSGSTRLLDPTCGSGTALRAALKLGAASVLGIEGHEGFAQQARHMLAAFERELERQVDSGRADHDPSAASAVNLADLGLL